MKSILSLTKPLASTLLSHVNEPAPVIVPLHSKPSGSILSSSGKPIAIFAPLGVSTPNVRVMS